MCARVYVDAMKLDEEVSRIPEPPLFDDVVYDEDGSL